jgi:hypothetical protein
LGIRAGEIEPGSFGEQFNLCKQRSRTNPRAVRMRGDQRGQLVAPERPELEHEHDPDRRIPSAKRRMRRGDGSSARNVAINSTRWSSTLCARNSARSNVEERLFEDPQLRAARLLGEESQVAERPERFDERLIGQVGPDEVDRAPHQDLEVLGAGSRRDLGHEPCLADAGLARHHHRGAAPIARRRERALQLSELSDAPHERCATPGHHRASMTG